MKHQPSYSRKHEHRNIVPPEARIEYRKCMPIEMKLQWRPGKYFKSGKPIVNDIIISLLEEAIASALLRLLPEGKKYFNAQQWK